ncbi:hypothetical protein ACTA71_006861 [Dictyostelium dimigraforme]
MSSSEDTSSDYDDYDEYELDEDDTEKEPSKWNNLRDGWQEFLEDENAFFVSQEDQNKQNGDIQIDESNKFYDPLGILKLPPRKAASVKKELLSLESESFSPVSFLSEIHSQTNFTELSIGVKKLKEESTSKAKEIKYLVKENFEHFVKCKDTVDEVYNLISNSKMLEDMSGSFTKIISKSSTVYHPLLSNKKKADEIRKVLTLLNKYKVIFKLPGKIQENIKQNEFEKAVHNYKNAKTLITSSQKKEFQKILLDIEKIAEDFRIQLFHALADPSTKLEQLKKSIKTLMEIGNGKGDYSQVGDPCWYFLSTRYNAITLLIKQCSEDNTLPNYKIIRKLSILLLSNIPNLFKMGVYYIEGKFEDNKEYLRYKQQQQIQLQQQQQLIQQQQQLQQQQQPHSGKSKESKAVNVVVYYLDETFSSYRMDQEKKVKDLIELCRKRFIEEEDDEFCLYKLSEKKIKSEDKTTTTTNIKLLELSHDESPFKLQKKWADKNSSTKNHRFLFKRKADEFTVNNSKAGNGTSIYDKEANITQIDLNASYKTHKKQNSAATSAMNEEKFKQLIINVMELYSSKVEQLFFDQNQEDFPEDSDDEEENLFDQIISTSTNEDGGGGTHGNGDTINSSDLSIHMVENVNEVIKCQEMLQGIGMPELYLSSINSLTESLILHFIRQICSEMVAEVSFLYLLEDWTINESSEDALASGNQVDGMITTRLMGEFVNTIKVNLAKLSFLSNKPMLLPSVESALCEAIESFGDCLHHLAFNNESIQSTIEDSLNQMNNDEKAENELNGIIPKIDISSPQQQGQQQQQQQQQQGQQQQGENQQNQQTSSYMTTQFNSSEKLLLTLSNCSTVVSKTAVQLRGFYVGLFHQPMGSYLKKVIEKLGVLERLILERYVNEKNLMIGEFITRGVLFSGSTWLVNTHPTKVSSFILTILTKMVFIHHEIMKTINSIDISFGVIQRIFEFLLISLRHNFSLVDPLFISNEGKSQFLLDILFIENVLECYGNEKTVKLSSFIRKDLLFLNPIQQQQQQPIPHNHQQQSSTSKFYSTPNYGGGSGFNINATTANLDPILKRNIEKTSLLYSCFKI